MTSDDEAQISPLRERQKDLPEIRPKDFAAMRQVMMRRGHYSDRDPILSIFEDLVANDDLSAVSKIETYGLVKSKRRVFYCPFILDFVSHPQTTTYFFRKIFDLFISGEKIEVSLEALRYISPNALTVLSGLLDSVPISASRNSIHLPFSARQRTNIIENSSTKLRKAYIGSDPDLTKLEYEASINNNQSHQRRKKVPLFVYGALEKIEDTFLGSVDLSKEELFYLNTALIEAMLNVHQHSRAFPREHGDMSKGTRFWVSIARAKIKAAKYIDFDAEISVLDFGCTIPTSLSKFKKVENAVENGEVLNFLSRDRASRTTLKNRGFGFQDFLSVAKELPKFELLCVSGHERLLVAGNRTRHDKLGVGFPGTFLCFRKESQRV